ncbi:MAG: ATP-binding protein [Microcoleaceae cyanobacterium]
MLNTSEIEQLTQILYQESSKKFHLASTLQDLSIYHSEVDFVTTGIVLANLFKTNPLLPGVILLNRGELAGMISRRKFLEYISRPFGRELFLQRSIETLYRFAKIEMLVLSNDTLIVDAARKSLQRSSELLYEPIVVKTSSGAYGLIDIHQLLVAKSDIHQLATKLLHQQTQSQLIQTEKLASLGQMVAGVAHEIKNPVGCILGNTKFLFNYYQDLNKLLNAYEQNIPEKIDNIENIKDDIEFDFLQQDLPELIQSIIVSAEQLNQLIGSLKNFSYMSETKPKQADIHECIDSTLLILRGRLKHQITVIKNYGKIPLLNCYSGQLSQVFVNLFSNAIEALEDKKEELSTSPTIWINTELENNNYISIRIIDNGPGIPLEIQDKIFNNFFTTKPVGKGTGLGLTISYQIITEKHGGKLRVNSTPGNGTEFEILLPLPQIPQN